jgi:23S rRNA (adenine2030-N6)-methyltransferase
MLSYRHAFHAGNFADVLKHSVLCLIINGLKKKDKPFICIDTHAGAGKYALNSATAQKTAEYLQGVALLDPLKSNPHPLLKDYIACIRSLNSQNLNVYPGSPFLMTYLMRSQDRLQLSELHPTDFDLLQTLFKNNKHVTVAQENGLERLPKKLPPIQRRGLIFIDPSYEIKSDYDQVVTTITQAYAHFATGIYALWYPVINRPLCDRLHSRMAKTAIRRQLVIEHNVQSNHQGAGMTGSGLIVINPPWQLKEQMEDVLPWLNSQLSPTSGHWTVNWLVEE